jgi:hypothetical protein
LVIAINSITTIKLMHVLYRLMVLWWAASREKKRLGQVRLIRNGVKELL